MAVLSGAANAAGGAASVANSAVNLGIQDAAGAAHLAVQWSANMISEDVAVAQKVGSWMEKI